MLQRDLERAGFAVETVTTGDGVVARCAFDPPDVLLLDLELPDMDGFDTCTRVRCEANDQETTVIVMCRADDDMTRTYLGPMVDFAGGDYFVTRPCDGNVLVQLVEELTSEPGEDAPPRGAGFPTRVAWPTARRHTLTTTA